MHYPRLLGKLSDFGRLPRVLFRGAPMMRGFMRNYIAVCLAFVMLLVSCASSPQEPTLEIHMLDVGEADCLLVKQGERAMLIDGGNPQDADRVVSYLHKHGVKTLDMIVISHSHTDHIGSLQRVIEAYDVEAVYYTAFSEQSTPIHSRLGKAIEQRKVAVHEVTIPQELSLGEAAVSLYPMGNLPDEGNGQMLITAVTYGGRRALFMGDADEEAQRAMFRTSISLRADVLKVPHHGGWSKTNEQLFREANPRVSLISCGADNVYGHPHEKTVTLLKNGGTTIYRTDVHGDTIVTIHNNGEYFITTAR